MGQEDIAQDNIVAEGSMSGAGAVRKQRGMLLTRLGAGDYRATLSKALADADMIAHVQVEYAGGAPAVVAYARSSTDTVKIIAVQRADTGAGIDPAGIYVTFKKLL